MLENYFTLLEIFYQIFFTSIENYLKINHLELFNHGI